MKIVYLVLLSFFLGSVFGYFSHEAKLEKERYEECNKQIASRFSWMESTKAVQDNKTLPLRISGGRNVSR